MPASESGAGDDRRVSRRELVHELADRTLPVAGGLLSTSGALTRALRAAGDALYAGLDGLPGAAELHQPQREAGSGEASEGPGAQGDYPPLWPVAAPEPTPTGERSTIPLRTVSIVPPDVAAILDWATVAVIGVTGSDGRPHLVSLRFAWDGEAVRVLSLAWSAVARGVRQDSRVSACLIDPETGRFATLVGEARIIEGEGVRDAARPVLARYQPSGSIEDAWRALEADGDRVVIRIHPVRAFAGTS